LRRGRNLKRFVAVECGNPDLAAERQSGEVERYFAVQVVAVALEEWMILHVDDDVEVA